MAIEAMRKIRRQEVELNTSHMLDKNFTITQWFLAWAKYAHEPHSIIQLDKKIRRKWILSSWTNLRRPLRNDQIDHWILLQTKKYNDQSRIHAFQTDQKLLSRLDLGYRFFWVFFQHVRFETRSWLENFQTHTSLVSVHY